MSGTRVLVTGANGHLGRRLVARVASAGGANGVELVAAVRSERAAAQVAATPGGGGVDVRLVDYASPDSLKDAATGANAIVHLVGIIKETRDARYVDAHERACEALASAAEAAGVGKIVYLSILGSRPDAQNACLASKGRAEEALLRGGVPTCVLRVPMVLGPGDHATHSLRAQARARLLALPGGGGTIQQPIDAEDVVSAILAALTVEPPIRGALDLGGPEALTHRALVARAAKLHGRRPLVLPLPIALVRAGIAALERLAPGPPMTVAMFDVLQRDDGVDPGAALARLGIALTPLDETLARYVGPQSADGEPS